MKISMGRLKEIIMEEVARATALEAEENQEDESKPESHDIEGHAMLAMKAVYDLALAAGVELQADIGGPSDEEYDEEEAEVELEEDE